MNQYQQLYQAPPYSQYEYQCQSQPYPMSQTQVPQPSLIRNMLNEEYNRKRGLDTIISPYKAANQQNEEKQKSGSPEVFYDMDAGVVRTEQRIAPINDMIISRLYKLSLELKFTVKSHELGALATKVDLEKLVDTILETENDIGICIMSYDRVFN